MRNTRFGLAILTLLVVIGGTCSATSPLDQQADKASVWMIKKLEYSQKILKGLTQGDFEAIRKNADQMIVVGYLEKWDRARMPEYQKQLKAFEAANKELIRQAQKKNVQGATKAYTQLIVSCVECHVIIRDARNP